MSYEFRKHWPKLKHKFNKQEKLVNKKLGLKAKKIKQKNLTDRQWEKIKNEQKIKGEDINIVWADLSFDNSYDFKKWLVVKKKWKDFTILNLDTEIFLNAILNEDVPSHLRNDFVVWDIVLYTQDYEDIIIQKRNDRINYLSKTRSNTSRFGSQREQIIAANIDIAIVVMPIKEPEFDYKLLDRYLVLCASRWVTPLVCINKMDLIDHDKSILSQYIKSWVDVVEISVKENEWIDILKKKIKTKTSVLLWKSWVWKTSIINIFCPDKNLLTQSVNQKSGEWKHTTTSSSLYVWDSKSYIIDTPGVRALWLDQIVKNKLMNYFPEFLEYKWKCKYSRCVHDIEPDCAVKNAVEDGEIDKYRYDSYLRILSDLV